MPQPALHLAIARRALGRWRRQAFDAPFPVNDEDCVNAFLHGALAPDTGFFPGNARFPSELVHTQAVGRFARLLFEGARTARMRAYASGWLSHALADVEIHPVINRAAAHLPDTWAARTAGVRHVAVEAGLDGWWLARSPLLSRHRLLPALDHRDAPCVSLAILDMYGERLEPAEVLASHRRVTYWYNAYLSLGRWTGRQARAWTPLPLLRRLLSWRISDDRPAFGFLYAILPRRSLVARVRAGILRHDLWLDRHVMTRCADLPDFDLETGERVDGLEPSWAW